MMTKLLSLAFLILVVFQISASPETPITLDQIIDLHTKAVGGKDAIESVQSIEFSIHIKEPSFEVDGVYKADRARHLRIDIFANQKRVYTEGYDGERGWQQGESGPASNSSPEGTAALWHGIVLPGKLFGLHEQAKIGNRIELAGRELLDGTNYYVLKLTLSDGFVTYLYLNPVTWLIERTREKRAIHVDLDPKKKWTESRDADFRMVDGIMRSFVSKQIDLKTGTIVQTTTLMKANKNPVFDPTIFQKPQ